MFVFVKIKRLFSKSIFLVKKLKLIILIKIYLYLLILIIIPLNYIKNYN